MLDVNNLPVPKGIRFLYQHLIDNQQIVEVENYNEQILHIIPARVFAAINRGEEGTWEDSMPMHLVEIIKSKKSFGFKRKDESFIYEKSDGQDAEYY